MLTRILPFLYEADQLEEWEDKFFWQARRKPSTKGRQRRNEVLFDESHRDDTTKPESEDLYEDARPLGEELIDTLIDLLFFAGFTLPQNDQSKKKVTYSIWQTGVGCNTAPNSSKEMENNRTEILRLLLALCSKSLYMPASEYHRHYDITKLLTYIRYSSCQRCESYYIHHYLSRQAGGAFNTVLLTQHRESLGGVL